MTLKGLWHDGIRQRWCWVEYFAKQTIEKALKWPKKVEKIWSGGKKSNTCAENQYTPAESLTTLARTSPVEPLRAGNTENPKHQCFFWLIILKKWSFFSNVKKDSMTQYDATMHREILWAAQPSSAGFVKVLPGESVATWSHNMDQ